MSRTKRRHTQDYAWIYAQEIKQTVDGKIWAMLGEQPMTDEEMEQRSGIRHQTLSGNRCHLVEDGFLRASGRMRVNSSGILAIVWERVPEAEARVGSTS